jgi:branched-chain amino acid transport system substrate-binding protein
VVVGWVNEQGGVLSFPDNTSAMNATVDFINKNLGGIGGHPLVVHTCFGAAVSDSVRCAQQMANDGSVKAVIAAEFQLDNEAFYATLGGKKPFVNAELVYPIDFTTPNAYSFSPGVDVNGAGIITFAQTVLHSKRLIVLRTDNPTGAAAFNGFAAVAKKAGIETVQVPVPEPGTAPQYTSAIAATSPTPNDLIIMYCTAICGVAAYDAIHSLHLTNVPVMGNTLMLLPPMPGHLKEVGATDQVYPDKWFYTDYGYTELRPEANSNGADAYVSLMKQYAPTANIHGAGPQAFGVTMTIAKILIEAGGVAATPDLIAQKLKTFTGPEPLVAGSLSCGAIKSEPNACSFDYGVMQRSNGQWVSIADGYNGKPINVLPLLLKANGG